MHKPVDLFDRAVSSLYETVLDPMSWGLAVGHLAALFEAHTVSLFDFDFATRAPSNFRLFGHDPEVERKYAGYYHLIDPGRSIAMHSAVGQWIADEQMLDLRSTEHAEYVQDFALRSGIGHVAGCKVTGDAEGCLFLSMQRHPGAGRFGESARRTFHALQPHLLRLQRMQASIDSLSRGQALAIAMIDRLQAAAQIVDRNGRIHLINASGRALLSGSAALRIVGGRLACRSAALQEHLVRLIDGACTEPCRGGGLQIPQASGGGNLMLTVVPIPKDHSLAGVRHEPVALVVVNQRYTEVSAVEVYRSLFEITAAEAALMVALAQGTSASDWAVQRSTSMATVRTQLRALFEKTGTHSQSRLVALAKSVLPIS